MYKYTATTKTVFYYLCESEREKVHDDRGSQLSVRRGKSEYTIIFFMVSTEFLLKNTWYNNLFR